MNNSYNSYDYQPQNQTQPQLQKREKKIVSILKAIGYFVLYLFVSNVIKYVIGLLIFIPRYYKLLDSSQDYVTVDFRYALEAFFYEHAMLLTLITNIIVIVGFALIFYLRRKRYPNIVENKSIFRGHEFYKFILIFIAGCFWNFSLDPILTIIFNIWPKLYDSYISYSNLYYDEGFILYILTVIISAPICEELVMRGAINTRLGRAMSPHLAILISSLCFGIIHGHWIQKVYAFLLGILLGYIMKKYGLFGSIALHFGFNFGSLPLKLLSEFIPDALNNVFIVWVMIIFNWLSIPLTVVFTILILKMYVYKPKGGSANV